MGNATGLESGDGCLSKLAAATMQIIRIKLIMKSTYYLNVRNLKTIVERVMEKNI